MPRIEEGPQPHDVHEKTGRYRQKAGISPNRTRNQVAENMDVTSNGTRLDRTKKSDTQNEGITRDVDEKKGWACIKIDISHDVEEK